MKTPKADHLVKKVILGTLCNIIIFVNS